MSKLMEKLELLLKLGGMKEDITFLVISGATVKMEEKEAWRKIFSSNTSPSASTALCTQSGQEQRAFPVVTPFKSWQMVAPHFSSNCFTNSLEQRGVPLPFVRIPATITAPIRAPQVLSIHPIPAA